MTRVYMPLDVFTTLCLTLERISSSSLALGKSLIHQELSPESREAFILLTQGIESQREVLTAVAAELPRKERLVH